VIRRRETSTGVVGRGYLKQAGVKGTNFAFRKRNVHGAKEVMTIIWRVE